MKVNICGIEHTIIECDDKFDVDTHMGMIDYNKAEIRINAASADPIKEATICHEVLHGLLVHIGRTDDHGLALSCVTQFASDMALHLCLSRHCDEGEQDGDDGYLVHIHLVLLESLF